MFLQPSTKVFVAVSIIALQLSRLSYFALLASTTIEVSDLQYWKAPYPILVMLLGIVIEAREVQSEKA